MIKIFFRFYAYLNYFFPDKDGWVHQHECYNRQSIKDRIEAMGIPHTEVFLILCNGKPVGFDYLVQEGDFFSVYPYFHSLELPAETGLRVPYKGKPKFILDSHLGKLARYLRRFNFDSAYQNIYSDQEIVDIAREENRIILTRDRGVLMRKRVIYGFFIHYDDPVRQLASVFQRYDLFKYRDDGSRCIKCNGELESVEKQKIIDRLEPKTKKYYQVFRYCPVCDKIYWCGTHYEKMEELLDEVKEISRI
jgi:uncharacterized protein